LQREYLLRSEELESLTARFFNRCEKYAAVPSSQTGMDVLDLADELTEIRRELASTADGLQFLIKQLKGLERIAKSDGYFSRENASRMLACCGFGNELARACFRQLINARLFEKTVTSKRSGTSEDDETIRLARKLQSDAERLNSDKKESKAEDQPQSDSESAAASELDRGEDAQVLVELIKGVTAPLRLRRIWLSRLERSEERTRNAAAIVPADVSDRFSRAETALERRMYRALGMLMAVREAASQGSQLPQLPRAGSPPPSSSN
jgi:hypothetical protein